MTLDACAGLVQRGDPDRFAAVMAAPVADRARLFPLYAFNLEVARAPWVTREPLIAEMRLQWWRDVVAEDRPRAHEVAGPLHGLIREAGLPVAVLDAAIAARRRDIDPASFDGPADFDAYLQDTGGGLMWLASVALGAGAAVEPAARDLGWATGLAGYLRAVPELVARGRRPLPEAGGGGGARPCPPGVAAVGPRPRQGGAARGGACGVADPPVAASDPGRPRSGWPEARVGLSEFDRRRLLAWQALTGRF